MLVSLLVKNFAIIDNIQIEFNHNMTVLTGETGAGKSLIIDAIGLLFGKRSSSDLIRFGETKATIEGVFSSYDSKIIEILGEEIDHDDYLVIKREIYANGKSLCKVNNNIVSLSQLVEISELIGDIHTQFDTQGLFNPKNYLQFIDNEDVIELIKAYQESLKAYKEVNNNYLDLQRKNQDDNQRLEFLKFQANELQKANLNISEEEDLKHRLTYLNNFENINQNVNDLKKIFHDNKVLDNIYEAITILGKLEKYDEKFSLVKKSVEEQYYNLNDSVEEIFHSFKSFDFDQHELDAINERLGLYSDLKRKYKKTTEEILNYQSQIDQEINQIENYDFLLENLEKSVKKSFNKTLEIAQNIRAKRIILAKSLESFVIENLADLQLKNTKFIIEFNELDNITFKNDGIDVIDFLITFNQGEPLRPLSKVASGGELSRFMLALKTLLIEKMNLQTIIFDEIDNGVSGAIAFSIANKIKQISSKAQVLCVTHHPQVAAVADNHLQISKITEENRTITIINHLSYEERIVEIAKMISNGEVTEASKNLAIELLK